MPGLLSPLQEKETPVDQGVALDMVSVGFDSVEADLVFAQFAAGVATRRTQPAVNQQSDKILFLFQRLV